MARSRDQDNKEEKDNKKDRAPTSSSRRTKSVVALSTDSQRVLQFLAELEAQTERVNDTTRHMREELDQTIDRANPRPRKANSRPLDSDKHKTQ